MRLNILFLLSLVILPIILPAGVTGVEAGAPFIFVYFIFQYLDRKESAAWDTELARLRAESESPRS